MHQITHQLRNPGPGRAGHRSRHRKHRPDHPPSCCPSALWGAKTWAGPLTSGDRWPGMIPTCRCAFLLDLRQVLGLVLLTAHVPAKDVELLVLRREVAVLRRANPRRVSIGRTGHVFARARGGCPGAALASSGHPGHDPGLASSPRPAKIDLPNRAGALIDEAIVALVVRMARKNPRWGSADSGRVAHTRPPRRRLHHPADPPPPRPTSAGPQHRHHLAAVFAQAGGVLRGRLLPRRLRSHPAAALRPVRDRGRRPLPARAGCDRAPRRALDHPAGPQPAHGPRRAGRPVPVPRPRPAGQFTASFDAVLADAGIKVSRSRPAVHGRTASPNGSC